MIRNSFIVILIYIIILEMSLFGSFMAHSAPRKKRKKEHIVLIDPMTVQPKQVSPQKNIFILPQETLATALLGPSSKAKIARGDGNDLFPELPEPASQVMDYSLVKQLITQHKYREAESNLKITLALSYELSSGERLRMALLRAKLLNRLGEHTQALSLINESQRHFDLATDDFRHPLDVRRVKDIKLLIEFTRLDIVQQNGVPL